MNMKVGMLFYILSLLLAFFSRKVFLDCLGADFIGLTGTLGNILGFLNVAELGIGTSITFFLYKPLQQHDKEKTNEVMSVLAYLYRSIGLFIGGAGLVISFFFPLMFKNQIFSYFLIYFAFISMLAASMVGYILNYRQLLVSANQKQYVVNGYFQTINIVQSLTQILLAYYYRNLYLWVCVGLFYTAFGCYIFNRRIDKEYPWLKIDIKRGKRLLKDYPIILQKTRQVFIQKIKNFILYRSDEILIFLFVSSLRMVAYYGNYMIIINKLNYLVNILSDGMNAGIGNLIAERNDHNTMKVFWELTAIRFLIVGIVLFAFLLFLQPFIACWLGAEYKLSDIIVYLLLFNIFIMLSRGVVEMYISACGLFSDVWAAWTELAANLIITFSLAPFLGITGILLGKILSVFFIAMFWKPYFLFSQGLHHPVLNYWKGMTKYYFIFALFCAITIALKLYFADPFIDTFPKLIFYAPLIYIPLMLCYFLALFIHTRGMKYFIARKPTIYDKLSKILRL